MEESFKNRIIIILAILTVIFFIGAVSSCSDAKRQKLARDREMATRLDLEEKMNKFGQEKAAIEKNVEALSQKLSEEQATHEATKKALLDEQQANDNLQKEVLKVTKLKEKLEEDLKEALVTGKSETTKK
jgi:valyl-tRNA synthetase